MYKLQIQVLIFPVLLFLSIPLIFNDILSQKTNLTETATLPRKHSSILLQALQAVNYGSNQSAGR